MNYHPLGIKRLRNLFISQKLGSLLFNLRMQSLRSLVSVSLLVALPTLFLQSVNGAAFHRNSLSVSSLSNGRSNLFGVSKIPRGGEEAVVEEEVETLYLPGLLDAELFSSSQVRKFSHQEMISQGPILIHNSMFFTKTANCRWRFYSYYFSGQSQRTFVKEGGCCCCGWKTPKCSLRPR